ncbi:MULTISPECIES: hypothetical protein [Arcobacteraceae]|uniref:Uncharacterized protein n=1 Tax=Poseidonibacter parvus TaxID=1850254 RepID=A0A1P8KJ58_9BACT|nr:MULTISPECIES: hypothetical protein [Arcobacteraceae]APW64588.1 hypothetical protein LPB137_01415 [Poseidonibacter parvus]
MLTELMNTVIGAKIAAEEKMKTDLKALKKDGKMKKCDFKKHIKEIEKKGKKEHKELKKHVRSMMKEIINELGLATKKDLKRLEQELKKK